MGKFTKRFLRGVVVSTNKTNPQKQTLIQCEIVLPATEPTSDRGDETQRAFRYQNAYGVILLAAGLSETADIAAIWCEHHEDLLVERTDGRLDAYQIKTKSSSDWKTTDEDLQKSLRRFAELEAKHGSYINRYVFASNCRPFVASKAAKNPDTIRKSPLKLAEAAKVAASPKDIVSPFQQTFSELMEICTSAECLFDVLKKSEFAQGPSLDDFEDSLLARHLPEMNGCKNLSVPELAAIRDELIQKVWEASSLCVPGPNKHLDIIGSDGKPLAVMKAKRIALEDARFIIYERSSYVFRYSPDALEVEYGSGKSKMTIVQRKMKAGGVAQHFQYIAVKAIAAEERLIAQGLTKPEEALDKVGHLEKVVLSECHEANIEAGIEPEDKRGLIMLNGIVRRLRDLSKNESEKVDGQPYEVLVGLAGLLSGECKVWWGIPFSKDDAHES